MKSSVELGKEAIDYNFNKNVPLKLYLSTCVVILQNAQLASQEGDIEKAYTLYLKYLDVCMNKLAQHPHVLKPIGSDEELSKKEYLQLMNLEVPAILKVTETLKHTIDQRYERSTQSLAKSFVPQQTSKENPFATEEEEVSVIALPPSFDEERFNSAIEWFKMNGAITRGIQNTLEQHTLSYPELPKLHFSAV
ncbi:HDL552Wp [Eremothecium sinecaudum]|uniref:Regulator of free ubiquitin chains 1 n=1 Tax=Eremothecium sinecaudum TaxID=45286 RepID=A0A120K223_9SACH|nr:HDL552Wp [Eremothecium sinecaudum]AMD20192.1 HDL552Wp [Eremothecium sinecaudum]